MNLRGTSFQVRFGCTHAAQPCRENRRPFGAMPVVLMLRYYHHAQVSTRLPRVAQGRQYSANTRNPTVAAPTGRFRCMGLVALGLEPKIKPKRPQTSQANPESGLELISLPS